LPGGLFFIVKTLLIVVFFVIVRAALPRVRYDQLMLFS
jgi:NADH-quinone oxidoreductase subunit H